MKSGTVDADFTGRHRTQQERRDTTRSALITSAAAVVLATGASTSVAAIAHRAGVSKGAVQHHFQSKDDLLVAVVSHGWGDLVERFAQLADQGAAPKVRVKALVTAMWESYQQPACRAAFLISADPGLNPVVALQVGPIFEAARLRLDDIWHEALADLDVPRERLSEARRFVRSHLLGMLVQRQLPSDEPAPDAELSVLCQTTLQILRTQSA